MPSLLVSGGGPRLYLKLLLPPARGGRGTTKWWKGVAPGGRCLRSGHKSSVKGKGAIKHKGAPTIIYHCTDAPFRLALECYAKTGQGWDKNLDSLCSILESELKTLDATFRFHTGGSLMKYTKKERMNIGRQIYEDQINKYEAAGKYGISAQTAREYMRMYRNTNHLPPKTSKPRDYGLAKAKVIPEAAKLDEYQKMSKEDLISALIDARIREERLKLGYEVVEEDDSKKKLITYVKKTAK